MALVKIIFQPHYFAKFAFYIMFIGQLSTSIDSYLHFNKIDLNEYFLVNDFDNTDDFDLDIEKLFKDKISNLVTVTTSFKVYKLKHNFHYKNALRPVDHIEIQTPPPDIL